MLKELRVATNKFKRKILFKRKATELCQLGYSEIKYPDLLQAVYRERRSDTLEIFGSGWSLASTAAKVLPDSYKVGFNLAGYSRLNFDLYFFEVTAQNYIGEAQRELLNCVATKRLVLKNLWSPNIETKQIALKEYPKFQFINDIWVPQDKQNSYSQLKSIINNRENYCQIGSTFTSIVAMGIQCEFKNIILHGVDFMGEHFFHSPGTKYVASLNYGRLDCPDGKSEEYLYENKIVANKDIECANYINANVIYDGILLRALFMLAAERGILIKSNAPSVSAGILR